jgi:hypothetical protein
MEGITEKDMIRAWGTPEQYYSELREFLEKHERADLRTVTSDTGVLVKVEYIFRPYQVEVERRQLLAALAEQAQDETTTPSE